MHVDAIVEFSNFKLKQLWYVPRSVWLMMCTSCRTDGVCDNLLKLGVLMTAGIKINLRPTIQVRSARERLSLASRFYDQDDHYGALTSLTTLIPRIK